MRGKLRGGCVFVYGGMLSMCSAGVSGWIFRTRVIIEDFTKNIFSKQLETA